jgi:hypothetical protein
LAAVGGVAGDCLAEGEQFQGLLPRQWPGLRLLFCGQVVSARCEEVSHAQFVLAGDGGGEGVLLLETGRCRRGPTLDVRLS